LRKIKLTFVIVSFCFVAKSQTPYYYYYKGEKHYLTLNTEYAFISVKNQHLSDNIQQRSIQTTVLRSDNSDRKQYQGKNRISRYYAELKIEENLSERQYLDLLSDIKRQNKDVIIAPYFKTQNGDKIGLSNFFYIKLKKIGDTTLLRQIAEQTNCVIVEQDQFMPLWFVLNTTENTEFNALEVANFFYESGLFQSAEPDLMVEYTLCGVNDPYFKDQWGLKNTGQYGGIPGIDIKAEQAWTITKGAGIKVAVFDEGIEPHIDLNSNIDSLSYDCEKGSPQNTVYGPHGVACAGIIGAVQNNGIGISGIAPECRLIPITHSFRLVDYVDSTGLIVNSRRDIAVGFNWGWKIAGVDVFNCSWKMPTLGYSGPEYIKNAIDSAITRGRNGKGAVIVFASGNHHFLYPYVEYPARLPQVIAVGALSPCGERKSKTSCDADTTWESQYGPELDISAPGVNIFTTDMQGNAGYDTTGNNYVYGGGTSLATPAVAAVCALVMSVNPCLTGAEVREIVESTAQKVRTDLYSYDTVPGRNHGTWNNEMGHGLVDAYAAVLEALNIRKANVDLMLRDNLAVYTSTLLYPEDDGTEPNIFNIYPTVYVPWDSPDLWCRRKRDNDTIHQAPVFGDTTYCYVRIKNRGNAPSFGNEVLKLYFAKEGTSLSWDSCWSGKIFPSTNVIMGNLIDSIVLPVVSCKGEITVAIPWIVPNPDDYFGINGIGNTIFSFRLLAVIESEIDTLFLSQTTNIDSLVRFNNNVSTKSITLSSRSLLIRNTVNDVGIEPDNSPIVWESPDIWSHESQGFVPNYAGRVNIRISNTSSVASLGGGNEVLKLYYAKMDTNLKWNTDLRSIGQANLPSIAAHGACTMQFLWTPPDSAVFNIGNNYLGFSLIAVVEEGSNPLKKLETNNLISIVRNNRNIGLKNVIAGTKIDLMIYDNQQDDGSVPSKGDILNSPSFTFKHYDDEWNRYLNFVSGGSSDIYVSIKNVGNRPYFSGATLSLYWAKSDKNISWDSCWTGKKGPLLGGFIGSIPIKNIPAGDEYNDDFIYWYDNIPNQSDYKSHPEPWKFYILAVIEDFNNDPTTYYKNIDSLVRFNNNVAIKTIAIGEKLDLYTKDNPEDTGKEANTTTDIYFQSKDIWVRNNCDSGTVHENPRSTYQGNTCCVYVKVRNIGDLPSSNEDTLYLHWSKGGTNLDWSGSWDGTDSFKNGSVKGGLIDGFPIGVVNPGKDTVIKFTWVLPNPNDYRGIDLEPNDEKDWHFCLLSRIVSKIDTMRFREKQNIHYNVGHNNNLAWKNVSIIEETLYKTKKAIISVGNAYAFAHPFCLKFQLVEGSFTLYQEAEITVKLGDIVYNAWERGGFQCEGMELLENQIFLIKSPNARLYNIMFEAHEVGLLAVQFNFLTKKITNQTDYTLYVIQTDGITDETIGGEVYEIKKSLPRVPFYANAGADIYAFEGDPITLTAANIGEPAIYNWYDSGGNLVCENRIFETEATNQEKYKLEVIARSDGYKDYDEVWVKIVPGKIESIKPNPANNNVKVTCVFNNVASAADAYLTISNQSGTVLTNYPLSMSPQTVDFNVSNYTPGTYIVTLICTGQIADSKTFVKQ
jgi:subtilisin family serine protease